MRRALAVLLGLASLPIAGCNFAQSRMERGDTAFHRQKYAEALENYRAARKSDPTLVGIDRKVRDARIHLLFQKGDNAARREEWDAAERFYLEVRQIDATNAEVDKRLEQLVLKRAGWHFHEGQRLLCRGNPFDAIAEFEQVLALRPEHPRAKQALQRAREQKSDRESKAEATFEEGLRKLSVEKFEAAIRDFTTVLNLNPHHPRAPGYLEDAKTRYAEALVYAGDAAMDEERWHEAVGIYKKARSHRASLPGLAQRLRRAQREARAERLVSQGDRAFQRDAWQEAFESYERARLLTSRQDGFLDRLSTAREKWATELWKSARSAVRAGNYEEALAKYRSIAGFHPDYREVESKAEELEIDLRTAERAYEAGVRAQEEKRLREARERFRVCADVAPGYRDLAERRRAVEEAFTQAQSLYRRGVRAQARDELERARILLEESLAIVRPFQDAEERLESVRDRLMARADMQENYAEAVEAQEAKDLRRAHKLLRRLEETQPGYRDVAERMQEVKAGLRTAKDLYDRAVQAGERAKLERAETLFGECLAVVSAYRDAGQRRKRAALARERLEEARKLEEERRLLEARSRYRQVLDAYPRHAGARQARARIANTLEEARTAYDALLAAEREGRIPEALSRAQEIHGMCRGFRDVDARLPVLEAEAAYEQGVEREQAGDWAGAIEAYETALEQIPGFRDARERLDRAEERRTAAETAAEAEPSSANAPQS